MQDLQGILIVLTTVVVVAFIFILPGLIWKHNIEKRLQLEIRERGEEESGYPS